MMKVISVWNPKGGQGKSLLALNLAAAAVSLHDLKVLVLCRDLRGTATKAAQEGNLPFDVKAEFDPTGPQYDLIIGDTGANDWTVPDVQTLIIPTKPGRSQYAGFQDALVKAEKADKRIIQVITDTDYNSKDEKATTKIMKREGAFEVARSSVFSKADEEFRTIFDPALNRASRIKMRRKEIEVILAAALNTQISVKEIQSEKEKAYA